MGLFLQIWGGAFYLLNKIFFSLAERSDKEGERLWRIRSWTVYLIGLPAWIILLIPERNWMVVLVEAGGAPSMLLGLMIALRGENKTTKPLDYFARVAAVAGIAISLYDFGGLTTWNQVLELGVSIGFLVGTYLLANKKPTGYAWYFLMNGSCAVLMWIQDFPWLAAQQVASLGFIIDAYLVQKNKRLRT